MPIMSRLILVLCGLAAVASAQATKPGGTTQRDLCRVQVAAFRDMLVGGYDADGLHQPKSDADAHAFLDRMAVRLGEARFDPIYRSGTDGSNDAVLSLAEKLKDCDNPLVNYCRYMVYRDAKRPQTAQKLLADAGPAVIDRKYAAYWQFFAAADLARVFPKEPKWITRRDDLLPALLLKKQSDPLNRRNLLYTMRSDIWNVTGLHRDRQMPPAKRQALLDTLAKSPDMDPWLLGMLRGKHEIAAAWEARGSGWGYTVTNEGAAGFSQHIAASRVAFETAHALQPDYPDAAAGMIIVCMATDGDARAWFDRAIAANIDSLFAWDFYAQTLLPRWGGNTKAMLDLGLEAAHTKRYDTTVPLYLLDMLDKLQEEEADREALYRTPGLWPELAAMFDGYLAGPTPGVDVPLLRSQQAAYAWKCGAFDEAQAILASLGNQLRPAAFERFDVTVAEVREDCAALTGPFADSIKAIVELETAGKFADAAAGFNAIADGLPARDPSRRYCVRRKIVDGLRAAIDSGKPAEVPLADADAFSAFRGDTSVWKTKDGMLVYVGKPKTAGRLVHAVPLPERSRVRVEWSWTVAKPGYAPWLDVIFRDSEEQGLIFATTFPHTGRVSVHMGPYLIADAKNKLPIPADVWHTLIIDHEGDSVTVESDGVKVIDQARNLWLAHGRPMLGLTVHNASVDSSVRIRKLIIEPWPKP